LGLARKSRRLVGIGCGEDRVEGRVECGERRDHDQLQPDPVLTVLAGISSPTAFGHCYRVLPLRDISNATKASP
jgi:hypothetical protein